MARIPVHTTQSAPEQSRNEPKALEAKFGRVINIHAGWPTRRSCSRATSPSRGRVVGPERRSGFAVGGHERVVSRCLASCRSAQMRPPPFASCSRDHGHGTTCPSLP